MSLDRDNEARLKQRATQVIRDRTGLDERLVSEVTDRIFLGLYDALGGERIYFSRPKDARDEAVLREMEREYPIPNGHITQVRDRICRKHRISKHTFYRIKKRRDRQRRLMRGSA